MSHAAEQSFSTWFGLFSSVIVGGGLSAWLLADPKVCYAYNRRSGAYESVPPPDDPLLPGSPYHCTNRLGFTALSEYGDTVSVVAPIVIGLVVGGLAYFIKLAVDDFHDKRKRQQQ